MITITRKIEFDAGHRILGHEGMCANLHGHRYVAEFTIAPIARLDEIGRVVDFSVVKQKMKEWIDERWDHNILLHVDDPLVKHNIDLKTKSFKTTQAALIFNGRMPYLCAVNPTAEHMAEHLFYYTEIELGPFHIEVISITLHETPNCKATATKTGGGSPTPVLTPSLGWWEDKANQPTIP